MKNTVFDYDDYKGFLKDWLKNQPKGGHGLKSAMADSLRCQPAYVTQVLNGAGNFSLEQADSLTAYLGLGEAEAEFFLLLVQWERAGSKSLRDHFQKAVERIRTQRMVLKERLRIEAGLSEQDQSRYYGDWRYTAVHMLITIPKFQNRQSVAARLNLSKTAAAEILDFLVRTGLAELAGDTYRVTKSRLHLGNDSPRATETSHELARAGHGIFREGNSKRAPLLFRS